MKPILERFFRLLVILPILALPLRAELAYPWNLFAELNKDTPDGIVFSPTSLDLAFGMLYAGARGESAAEMDRVLGFSGPSATFQRAADVIAALKAAEADERIEVRVANRLWYQHDWNIHQEYLDLTGSHFQSVPVAADFVTRAEPVRKEINEWVEEITAERIKELLAEGTLDSLTRLVLVNALYLKSPWKDLFFPEDTKERDFQVAESKIIQVPMMQKLSRVRSFADDHWKAIELPLLTDDLTFLVVMPAEGTELDVEKLGRAVVSGDLSLNPADWGDRASTMIRIPRFRIEGEMDLKKLLSGLGLNSIFHPGSADLSGIADNPDLHVSDAVQKTFLNVVEEGVEAAAATAIAVRLTSMPHVEGTFYIDRPFFHFIRENTTGELLFAGSIRRPKSPAEEEEPKTKEEFPVPEVLKQIFDGAAIPLETGGFQTPVGIIQESISPWFKHQLLGLCYFWRHESDLWVWTPSTGWLWTRLVRSSDGKVTGSSYPVLRRESDHGWIRLQDNPPAPGWYYDYRTGRWRQFEPALRVR